MSSSSKAPAEKPQETPPAEKPPFAILFQIEDVAVNGHAIGYEILKGLLGAAARKALTPALFARHAVGATPEVFVPAILEAIGEESKSADKLVAEFRQEFAAKVSANDTKPEAPFAKIIGAAKQRKYAFGAVTALPETTAAAVIARLGLDDANLKLFPFQNGDKGCPGPTTWIKTARAIELRPRRCAVISTNMLACKAALSADMRCVATPDDFTAHQDFTGVDIVVETPGDMSPAELLDTLFPAIGT